MRVCLLAHNPCKGSGYGLDRYSYELITRIKKRLDNIVITQGEPDGPLTRLLNDIVLPFKIARIRVSLYHALSQTIPAPVIARKHPLVTTIHDLIPFKNSLTSFYLYEIPVRPAMRFEFQRLKLSTYLATLSDLIIVPFQVTKQDLVLTLGVKEEKIKVVPLGVDLDVFRPIDVEQQKKDMLRPVDKKILLFVGGVNPAKGSDILINAFGKVIKDYRNCELWIAGKWSFSGGVTPAEGSNAENNIRFLGHIPEEKLPLYYNLADIFVFPSRIGFCLQILEAMACKVPVIASNTPDIKEMVGDAAVLLSPRDTDGLAQSILSLLSNDERREKLAEKAYKRVRDFSWDNTAEKTIEVYLELTGGSRH